MKLKVNTMKKIYNLALATMLSSLSFGQSFFVPTSYRGAFAPAPTTMWTDGWCNWDPQNAVYPASTVNITTAITTNTTWTSGNTYLLQGQIYVKNGATLTIEPGTIVLGDKNTVSSGLFVTQGSKLNAQGTAAQPIIFTSNQVVGARGLGDWAGIILMGKAALNLVGGIANIEGIAVGPDTQFGGGVAPDNNDNSGILSYVRIEFGGYILAPNKEINGLTLGAVGKATKLDHIQVSFTNDDAFEWFGGTVNGSHLVSYRNVDDDFDTDNGFSGNIQYGLIVRDPALADNPSVSTSEGFESDNDATGSASTPQTSAIFSNITAIGPLRGNVSASVAAGYRRALRLRKNTALRIYNSIFMDFKTGLFLDNANAGVEASATSGNLKFNNNLIAGCQTGKVTERIATSTYNVPTFFANNMNDSLIPTTGILTTPYDYFAPDYRPISPNSPGLANISFTDNILVAQTLTAPAATTTVSYCEGATSSALSATAVNGNTLAWYTTATGGTASSSAITPSTSTAGTTSYFVAQTNGTNEGPRTEIVVTINALPNVPSISPNGPTTFCTGGSVTLSAPAGFTYLWSNSLTTPSITVNASGNFTVTVTNANGCAATSGSTAVNVSNSPVPTVSATGALTFCSGDSITLSASTSDSYLWSNGLTAQTINVSTSGTYFVTVTNANACNGVGQSANSVVSVGTTPVASIGTPSIVGNVVTFSNTSTGATSHSWEFGDFSNSSAPNPVHAYVGSQTYTVTYTAINGSCSSDTTFSVAITTGVEESTQLLSTAVYPNPTSGIFFLEFNEENISEKQITITSANGSIVYNSVTEENKVSLNGTDFEAGIYFITIQQGSALLTKRVNIIK